MSTWSIWAARDEITACSNEAWFAPEHAGSGAVAQALDRRHSPPPPAN
jgi:hypothetical protein